jgi:hypothetical protein
MHLFPALGADGQCPQHTAAAFARPFTQHGCVAIPAAMIAIIHMSLQSELIGDMSDTVVFSLDDLKGLGRHRGNTFGPHPLQVRPHLAVVVLGVSAHRLYGFERFNLQNDALLPEDSRCCILKSCAECPEVSVCEVEYLNAGKDLAHAALKCRIRPRWVDGDHLSISPDDTWHEEL